MENKLQQGDYVRNLTKKQFNELMEYQPNPYIPNTFFKYRNEIVFDGDYFSSFLEDHELKTKLSFSEFKQRAINTFNHAN